MQSTVQEAPVRADRLIFEKGVVIAGPPGAGKSTIVKALIEQCSGVTSVLSSTSRAPRPGEIFGIHYRYYAGERAFMSRVEDDSFVEHILWRGNHYGVEFDLLGVALGTGKVPLFTVELEGIKTLRSQHCPDLFTIFLMPSSLDEAKRRLEARPGTTSKELEERVDQAKIEMEIGPKCCDMTIYSPNGALPHNIALAKHAVEGYLAGAYPVRTSR